MASAGARPDCFPDFPRTSEQEELVSTQKGFFQAKNYAANQPPLTGSLHTAFLLSWAVAVGMAIASAGGLLWPTAVYPTEALRQAYIANDAVNLIVGLPILLAVLWLTKRGRLIGLLSWPGALLYVFYNYVALIFGRPVDWMSFFNLALLLLSAYAVFALIRCIDGAAVKIQLATAVSIKYPGWVLIFYGSLFLLLALSTAVKGLTEQTTFTGIELGLVVADTLLSLLLVGGGGLLLQKRPLGYVVGLGLLFAASALFAGVIIVLMLQPIMTGTIFDGVGVLILLVMSSFCFFTCVRFMITINWLKT
jgi:hypothetical protein